MQCGPRRRVLSALVNLSAYAPADAQFRQPSLYDAIKLLSAVPELEELVCALAHNLSLVHANLYMLQDRGMFMLQDRDSAWAGKDLERELQPAASHESLRMGQLRVVGSPSRVAGSPEEAGELTETRVSRGTLPSSMRCARSPSRLRCRRLKMHTRRRRCRPLHCCSS